MALSELTAFETAYQALRPLDVAGRRRAISWLTDALEQAAPLASSAAVAAATKLSSDTETVSVPRRRRAAAAEPAKTRSSSGQRKRAGATKATAATGSRVYRRMPDPDEVMAAYAKAGTVSGLADHFDVPLHTVTHWARRLREQGFQIGRQS